MKIACIGDENTVSAMRLAGVSDCRTIGIGAKREKVGGEGNADGASDSGEYGAGELNELLKNPEIGVILIPEKLADLLHAEIDAWRSEHTLPVIVEMPDKRGPIPGRPDSISGLIKRAIGIDELSQSSNESNVSREES